MSLSFTETGSGLQATRYILTTGGIAGAQQTYASAIPLAAPSSGSTVYSVEYWSVDNATNAETPHRFTSPITINAPVVTGTTTLTINMPWDSGYADMDLSIYDENGALVDSYYTPEDHSASLTCVVPAGHQYTMNAWWWIYDSGPEGADTYNVTPAEAAPGATITWNVAW